VEGQGWRLGRFPDGIQTDSPEADAKLIAAAPDLLAVARNNGRWAKVDCLGNGTWYAALGYKGSFEAVRVLEYAKPIRSGAIVAATRWIADGAQA